MQGVVLLHDDESQESKEKSAERKVLQKSHFLDLALTKVIRILPIFFSIYQG